MKKTLGAFTLTEILVVIAVIGILWVWLTRLNFSRISQTELVSIESIKILTSLEEMRNNALVWKAEDIDGEIPISWDMTFDQSWGEYITSITDSSWIRDTIRNTELRNPLEIVTLTCTNLDGSNPWTSSIITISFLTWWDTQLDWCPAAVTHPRILDIEVWFWSIIRTIRINTLTDVIEEL